MENNYPEPYSVRHKKGQRLLSDALELTRAWHYYGYKPRFIKQILRKAISRIPDK